MLFAEPIYNIKLKSIEYNLKYKLTLVLKWKQSGTTIQIDSSGKL